MLGVRVGLKKIGHLFGTWYHFLAFLYTPTHIRRHQRAGKADENTTQEYINISTFCKNFIKINKIINNKLINQSIIIVKSKYQNPFEQKRSHETESTIYSRSTNGSKN